MVRSSVKPSEIQIISVTDDIRKSKTRVKYAFNYNIQEVREEMPIIDEQGNEVMQTQTMYEYEQFVFESEFDLFMKNVIPEVLKTMYAAKKDEIMQNLALANTKIPKEINIGE
ncbi:Hypothetical protein MPV1_38 [Marinitoga phage MPV1]|uniref:Uncharacterized protein n=1 Tax=Marinitoga piezophila (strain DSM 14283 / JCM 11233 / KA3) TaxID=443254 RepID=H2J4D1_MARPK|nr:hypothetical protein [Marinitoga piezophila]AEX84786.1 hypothetical protein Marpi_0336 [Marinitoga piezophila KA3]